MYDPEIPHRTQKEYTKLLQLLITNCNVIHDCAASQLHLLCDGLQLQGLSLEDAKCLEEEIIHTKLVVT